MSSKAFFRLAAADTVISLGPALKAHENKAKTIQADTTSNFIPAITFAIYNLLYTAGNNVVRYIPSGRMLVKKPIKML